NNLLSSSSEIDTSERANYFAAFTAAIEAILLLCLFYTVYFRYRSFAERTHVAQTAASYYKQKEMSENQTLLIPENLPKTENFSEKQAKNGKISENQGKNGNITENQPKEVEADTLENKENQGEKGNLEENETPKVEIDAPKIKEDTSELELLLIPQHATDELKQEIADKIRAIQRERNKVTTAEWRLRNKQGLEKTNKANIDKGNEELKRLRGALAELYAKANLNGKAATLFDH
ncbi:MAG: hypothetical protein ACKVTZ_10325, partial [Bacteroidia bacterium]